MSETIQLAERMARGHEAPTLELLCSLYDQVSARDKPTLAQQKGRGALFPGNLGEPPIWGWREEVRVRPDDPGADLDRIRAWLDAHGWERFETRRPEPEATSRHRKDGYVVRAIGYPDGRILLDVKSPCFDHEGRQVPGMHGQQA